MIHKVVRSRQEYLADHERLHFAVIPNEFELEDGGSINSPSSSYPAGAVRRNDSSYGMRVRFIRSLMDCDVFRWAAMSPFAVDDTELTPMGAP